MINVYALARTQNGAHRSELPLEAKLGVEGTGGVVFGSNDYEGLVPASGDFLGEASGEVDAVAFPAELGAGLHGEHGAVVGLHHPGGEVALDEDAVGGQLGDQLLEHLAALDVTRRVQVVHGLHVLRLQAN